jgi:PAS domain S-box-containing protein
LVDQIPFNVAVIDADFKIVAANRSFEEFFGEWQGRHCYEVYKEAAQRCERCQAVATFQDGQVRVSDETGVDRHGRPCHYVVHLAPLRDETEQVRFVIEMTTDLTETRAWRREYDLLFERVPCSAMVIDRSFRVIRANDKFRQSFGDPVGKSCYEICKRGDAPCSECTAALTFADGGEHTASEVGILQDGSHIHYVVTSSPLSRGREGVAHVIQMMTDVTEVYRLEEELRKTEQEKLDAERLAAVGQTVAGLAHTIKNLLMGLEGGMYMVDSGMSRGDGARIKTGWQMLQRNFEKTTTLVKDFLSFAKGRLPELSPTDPNALGRDIVNLYVDAARMQGVELVFEPGPAVQPAPLDPHGIETCLTNLLSNGIDAAAMRPEGGGKVVLRTREENGDLVFEVADNGGGMDWEVKGKVFTTFFTTKGGKGTGLGLLTTRKIVQEHGGRIDVESTSGEGATFRICLPRERLCAIAQAAAVPEGPKERLQS